MRIRPGSPHVKHDVLVLPLVLDSRVVFAIDTQKFLIHIKGHFVRFPRELIDVGNVLRIESRVVGLVLYTICAIPVTQIQAERSGIERRNDFHLN